MLFPGGSSSVPVLRCSGYTAVPWCGRGQPCSSVPVFSAAVPLEGRSHGPSAAECWASGAGSVWQVVQIPLLLCRALHALCALHALRAVPRLAGCPRAGCARQRAGAAWARDLPTLLGTCRASLVPANRCASSSGTPLQPPRSRSLIPRDGFC